MMGEININDYVTFVEKDSWLTYVVDKIDFVSTKNNLCYCFGTKGKFSIHIGQQVLDTKDNSLITEVIKHELAHGIFGHLNKMQELKTDTEKKLFNILADCSIHINMANPDILDKLGKVCTYEREQLPILPPDLLFEKLRTKIKQLEQWINQHIKDSLWKQKGISGIEQEIITHSIQQGLQEAQEDGKKIPDVMSSGMGTEHGAGTDYEFLFQATPKDLWVDILLRKVRNRLEYRRTTSWRKEPHEEIGNGVMKRGYTSGNIDNRFLFAMDVSGSMDLSIIKKGLENILQHTGIRGEQHEILFFDTRISKKFKISEVKAVLNEAHNYGGGTYFRPCIEYAKPNDNLVIFTDGGGYDLHKLIQDNSTKKFSKPPIFVHTDKWHRESLLELGEVISVY